MAYSGRLIPHLVSPLFGASFEKKIRNLFTGSILAFWPLTEGSGATAFDISGNGYNAAYTGVTLADATGPRSKLVPFFDGANDYCTLYSTYLRDAFAAAGMRQTGSLLLWVKAYNAGVWTDATNRNLFRFIFSSQNIAIYKTTANNQISYYFAGSTASKSIYYAGSPTAWFQTGLTWSSVADELKAYYNGAQTGATTSGFGAISVAMSSAMLGAYGAASAVWNGWLGYALMLTRVATATEMAKAYSLV